MVKLASREDRGYRTVSWQQRHPLQLVLAATSKVGLLRGISGNAEAESS